MQDRVVSILGNALTTGHIRRFLTCIHCSNSCVVVSKNLSSIQSPSCVLRSRDADDILLFKYPFTLLTSNP